MTITASCLSISTRVFKPRAAADRWGQCPCVILPLPGVQCSWPVTSQPLEVPGTLLTHLPLSQLPTWTCSEPQPLGQAPALLGLTPCLHQGLGDPCALAMGLYHSVSWGQRQKGGAVRREVSRAVHRGHPPLSERILLKGTALPRRMAGQGSAACLSWSTEYCP